MALLDWSGFLERIEHNEALALELGQDLLLAAPRRLGKLEEAIGSKDQKLIEQAAHALRGLISPYGPVPLLAAIKLVEENARAKSFHLDGLPLEIRDLMDTLRTEVAFEVTKMLRDD